MTKGTSCKARDDKSGDKKSTGILKATKSKRPPVTNNPSGGASHGGRPLANGGSDRGDHDENSFLRAIKDLKKTIPIWDSMFSSDVTEESRSEAWVRLDVLAQPLCEQFAWAIPDDRALRILSEFQPLIELGCGKAYWASLLRDRGVDIIAADKYVDATKAWTEIISGGPEILAKKRSKGRNLFLCYPDESESLGIECLHHFQGEYIIHVGEMITTGGTKSGPPQAPWGRTTSSDFQIALAEDFHCLLIADIPSLPFAKDTISVWKRTSFVNGLQREVTSEDGSDDDNEEDDCDGAGSDVVSHQGGASEESSDSDDSVNLWTSIPPNEQLPTTRAAPCLQHLLQ